MKTMKLNSLDNLIKLNFKMIDKYLGGIAAIVLVAVMLMMQALFFGGFTFIFIGMIAGVTFLSFKMFYTLFYDSIFGKKAYMVNSLPVSAGEIIVSRIYVAVMAVLIVDMVTVLAFTVRNQMWGGMDLSDIESLIITLQENLKLESGYMTGAIVSLVFLSSLANMTFSYSAILFSVCFYQTLPIEKKGGLTKLIVAVVTLIVYNIVSPALSMIMSLIGIESIIANLIITVLVNVAIMVAACVGSIKLLERKLELA